MKRLSTLILLTLILTGCGDEIHNHHSGEQSSDQTNTHGDSGGTNGQSTSLDLSLLSPTPSKIDGKAFITKGKPLATNDKRYVKVDIDYLNEKRDNNHRTFEKGLKVVTLSGKHLIIDEKDIQGIRDFIHMKPDVAEVSIQAETVELNTELHVPGAEITLHARTLKVGKNGVLNNTPLTLKTRAAQFQNGLKGIDGKDMKIFVKEMTKEEGVEHAIFIANGGNGQDAGLGQDGNKGYSMRNLGGGIVFRRSYATTCHRDRPYDRHFDKGNYCEAGLYMCSWYHKGDEGTPKWPGNGSNAKAGGKPGAPGKGGHIQTNFNLNAKFFSITGGTAGKPAPDTKGGAAGTPTVSYHQERGNSNRCSNYANNSAAHRTHAGKNATSPKAEVQNGEVGFFSASAQKDYIADGYFESNLKYARDLYKVNQTDLAVAELDGALEKCHTLKVNEENEAHLAKATEYCDQSIAMVAQIHSQKDFYGHSAAWVPNLSFEASYKAFNEEVDRSFKILYMTYWLMKAHNNQEAKLAGIEALQDQIYVSIEDDTKLFNDLSDKLPGMKTKIENYKIEEKQFRDELKALEERIIAQARANVISRQKKKKFLGLIKTVAAITSVIPAGQPAMAAVGASINAVASRMETGSWSSSITELPDIVRGFSPKGLEKSRQHWNENFGAIKYSRYKEIHRLKPGVDGWTKEKIAAEKKKYFAKLKSFKEKMKKPVMDYVELLKKSQVTKSEIDREIEKIKNSDPLFLEISNKLKSLMAKREALTNEIMEFQTNLQNLANDLTKGFLQIADLGEAQVKIEKGVDHALENVLEKIKEQTENRLDKYNYYLLKAYQYRTLSKYPGSFDLRPIIDKVKLLVEASHDGILAPTEFDSLKALYLNQMSVLVEQVIDRVNNGDLFHLRTKRAFKLSDKQIHALNEGHEIYLDLGSNSIFGNETELEDIRINKIEVEELGFDLTGEPEMIAEGKLSLAYSGKSYLKKDNVHYIFEFGDQNSVSRLKWGGSKDILSGVLSQVEPSFADQSLLSVLLNSSDDVILFARPGGLTQLKVKLETKIDGEAKAKLTTARIVIDYDYLD